jgi:ABC-type multidrug transport system fused ATPase/permease subunit
MLVFWPTLLLWLGSKIQGEQKPKPLYSIIFALALLLAVFTPYMIYFAIICVIFAITQPHLRFVLKSLPKIPLIITALIVISGLAALVVNIINNGNTIANLLASRNLSLGVFWNNLKTGLRPLLSWRTSVESIFLAPLISLPTFAVALIGLFSTTKGFFASRNSIASLLIVFTLIIAGFNSNAIIFFILPLSILTAHGLKYILEKWYGLFPENPYARVSAIFPLIILFGLILVPSLSQYIYGYHYNPNLANNFTNELTTVHKNLSDETLLVPENKSAFYRIIENSSDIKIITELPEEKLEHFASLGKLDNLSTSYQLSRIITSAKSDNSDIIYLYTAKGE